MLLDTSGLLCYVHYSELQHQEAVQLLNSSFILMRHQGISEALTTAHHFEQEVQRLMSP